MWVAIIIFFVTLVAIATEKVDKTLAVLVGASLMLILKVVPQGIAFGLIDLNVILLLISMMIIVGIFSRTGIFEWIAIKVAKSAKGRPLIILLFLSLVTAVLSAFLDNVTTVLLMAPITFLITQQLGLNPVPFLIIEVMASNIGGTATLIGDPPNILIGSAANLGFNDFLLNLAPVILVIMFVFVVTVILMMREKMRVSNEVKAKIMALDDTRAIRDKKLLIKCLFVLGLTLFAFLIHESLGLGPASVALAGATVLIAITGDDIEKLFKTVEWPTIFFLIGLFIIVAGVIQVGAVNLAAEKSMDFTDGNVKLTTFIILWISAVLSSVIGSVSNAVALIPVVKSIAVHFADAKPLWWALAMGTCLGGNGTIIGAPANIIIAGLAAKNGSPISFKEFLKYGFIFVLESMIICTIYIYWRYL
ncbi:MAG: ArsB/NhaD family transporter [Candidatus Aureabacteria bacterium]|nr:ArsB/NhaD family transporter [Candidatus Auribacterota bacterium]MCK5161804.1 ArsB/NhaD family transporter [Candidatus Auribacterota bacterium]